MDNSAEKLMVSQPSLSQLISKLEDEMGVQLFERTVPLTITYAGEVYVNTAKKILREEAEMQDVMAYLRGDNAGKLKIATGYIKDLSNNDQNSCGLHGLQEFLISLAFTGSLSLREGRIEAFSRARGCPRALSGNRRSLLQDSGLLRR